MDTNTTPQTAASRAISNGRRPRFLLLALAALVACLALVAGACNDSGKSETSNESDSSDSSDPGNSEADEDPTETGSADSDSGDSGSDDTSTDGADSAATDPADADAAKKQLEAATPSCEVLDSMESLFGTEDPTTTEEVKAFVDTFVTLVNKMAETAADPALAGQLETTAENLRKFAEDNGYEPAAMNFSGQPDYPGVEEDFAAVDQWYQSEIGNCVPEVGTAPTP